MWQSTTERAYAGSRCRRGPAALGRALPLLLQQLRLDALELPVEPLRLRGVFGRGSGEAAIAASRQPERPDPLNRRQPLPLPWLIGIYFRFEFFI